MKAAASGAVQRVWRVLLCTLLSIGLSSLGWTSTAAAADPAATFAEAQALYERGDHSAALPLFRRAHSATDSPNARLYVARCLRETGQLVEAYLEMDATVKDATALASKEARYAPTRNAAAAELALLEPLVAKLIVAPVKDYAGLEVRIDGELVDDGQLGQAVVLIPATVEVTAEAPGRRSFARTLELQAGATETLPLVLKKSKSKRPGDEEQDDEAGGLGGVQLAGIVIASVGVGGLAAFAATGVLADQRFSQLADECGGVRCDDPSYGDVVDEGKTFQLAANVSAGVGGVLLATGVGMLLFGPAADDTSEEEVAAPGGFMFTRLSATPLSGGVFISTAGQF